MTPPGQTVSRVSGADTAAVWRGRGGAQGPLPRGRPSSSNRETAVFAWQVPGALGCDGRQQSHLGFNTGRVCGSPWTAGCSHIGPGQHSDDTGRSAVTETSSIWVRKDRPHHRLQPRGDTSHSWPAACDVALEVSWGQTGSLGWYPVLGARLCAKHQGTKIPGCGPCPKGALSLVKRTPQPFPFSPTQ